jgi:hypothetical protein
MVLVRAVFIAQLVVMLPGAAHLLLAPVHLGTVAVFFYLAPIGLLAVLFAGWQFIRHPARRRWAVAIAATPFACLAAPMGIHTLNGGPVHPIALVVALVALTVIAALVVLSKTAQWSGDGLFANARFNLAVGATLGVLFLLLWLPIVAWLASDRSYSLPSNMADRDQVLRVGTYYLMSIGVPGLCLSLATLLYAPVGLVRNAGGRIVHFGQLVIALLLLLSLAAVAFAVFVSAFNPG